MLAKVLVGLEEATVQTGTLWHLGKLYYYSDDTPPLDVYHYLALELVTRVFEGGSFEESSGGS